MTRQNSRDCTAIRPPAYGSPPVTAHLDWLLRVLGAPAKALSCKRKMPGAGELLSSSILLEAAVKAQEQMLGFRDPSISAASRKAENLLSVLSGQERQQVGYLL